MAGIYRVSPGGNDFSQIRDPDAYIMYNGKNWPGLFTLQETQKMTKFARTLSNKIKVSR